MYTYQLGFQLLQVGKASALGIITLIFVAAIIATFSRILRRGTGEADEGRRRRDAQPDVLFSR